MNCVYLIIPLFCLDFIKFDPQFAERQVNSSYLLNPLSPGCQFFYGCPEKGYYTTLAVKERP